jgi:hypothetical protein
MFSNRDRCGVLNELAGMLVQGHLSVGSEAFREYDCGLAQVTFRVDPPGDKEALKAYGVPPGVDVLPVLWSLRRAAEGAPEQLTAAAQEEAGRLFRDIASGLDLTRKAPRGWELPTMPSFELDQRFGPLTPVVLARAAQLWQADDDTLGDFVHAALATSTGFSLSQPLLSTRLGRTIGGQAELVGWATCLATVLTHRARLSAEDVRTFAAPFARLMPQLESVINSPA